MRTLQTQVRLRRLLRVYSEFTERILQEPSNSRLPGVARDRLFELAAAVHAAWGQESVGVPVPAIRRHVGRTLNAVDAAVSGLGRRTADVEQLNAEVQEAAVPLLLMLRGMEDVPERQVLDWLNPTAGLARTA